MGSPVILNIYDLSEYNTWMYWCGAGGAFIASTFASITYLRPIKAASPYGSRSRTVVGVARRAVGYIAGIFHTGVEVYSEEYAFGGK